MEYLLLIVGFILIITSSNVLVDAASAIAIRLRIPKSLIALTIVAFGTCAPELAISFNSIADGNGDLALANVIGSCIINIVLVIGIAAIFRPIAVKNITIKKELPILLIITTAFCAILLILFARDIQVIYRESGFVLVALFSIFAYYLYKVVKGKKEKKQDVKPKYSMILSISLVIITLIVIMFSSDLIVNNAVVIAENLGVSAKVITMFVIVIGTSLPELVMTVTSTKKGVFDFALGNIIGTNIFNICIVLGLPILIYGDIQVVEFNIIDIFVVMFSGLMLYIFSISNRKLSRIEGIIMCAIFLLYYGYILM